nr:MAG TPA: LysW biosynthesis protein LysW [Caudoviricetes sp.]
MTTKEIIESIDYCLKCDNDRIPTTQKDLQTIKEALEKQIPKKPLKQKFGFCDLVGFFDFRLVCPECEQPIAQYFNKKEYKPRYCHNCGQALDWSEVEE